MWILNRQNDLGIYIKQSHSGTMNNHIYHHLLSSAFFLLHNAKISTFMLHINKAVLRHLSTQELLSFSCSSVRERMLSKD